MDLPCTFRQINENVNLIDHIFRVSVHQQCYITQVLETKPFIPRSTVKEIKEFTSSVVRFFMNILLNANSETSNNKAKTIGYFPILTLHSNIKKPKGDVCPNGFSFDKLLHCDLRSSK